MHVFFKSKVTQHLKTLKSKMPGLCIFPMGGCFDGCRDHTQQSSGFGTRIWNLTDKPVELQIRVGSILKKVHALKPGSSKRLKCKSIYKAYMPGENGNAGMKSLLYYYDETCHPYVWIHESGGDSMRMVKQQYISLEDLRDCCEIRIFRDHQRGCLSIRKKPSITILYFAKEEADCTFVPLFPEAFMPVEVPFQKGVGLKFRQASGTGIDLGFFELDDLSKPSPGEDVFPLVVSAQTSSLPASINHIGEPVPDASPRMQITQAVLEKNNGEPFQVKVVKQILWIDEVLYELREIYGIATSAVEGFDDNVPGKECVICMTEPKDTAVLPCRHMCMCSDCAKELRIQSNTCPICRQPIEELIEIKMNKSQQ